ncbi:hypothetical protein [Lewinella sp. 4G2]|uniref:hypothetical protein n=1 Tax=Lewinella sp. 4G2 TaxID=1803372 RepID=UPI0007B4AC46|nr:hypothetical protein [Lewinella sp. 4G2]OAV45524.1 hypothetical protein A3850_013945 [Lewinella sp. 4G2]
MKFRYRKVRALVVTFLLVAAVIALNSWREGHFDPSGLNVYLIVGVALLVFTLKYGTYIFNKYRITAQELTIKRPFRSAIVVPFPLIKNVVLRNDSKAKRGGELYGQVVIWYGDSQQLVLELDDLRYGEEFVRMLRDRPSA